MTVPLTMRVLQQQRDLRGSRAGVLIAALGLLSGAAIGWTLLGQIALWLLG
jgi:hypothetical protein